MEVRLKLLGAPGVCSHLLYRCGVIDSITFALAVAGFAAVFLALYLSTVDLSNCGKHLD